MQQRGDDEAGDADADTQFAGTQTQEIEDDDEKVLLAAAVGGRAWSIGDPGRGFIA